MNMQKIEVGNYVYNSNKKDYGTVIDLDGNYLAIDFNGDKEPEKWLKSDCEVVNVIKDNTKKKPRKRVNDYGEIPLIKLTQQEMVAEFHKAFKYPRSEKPVALTADEAFKRIVFIQEELIELLAASVDTESEFLQYVDKLEDKRIEAEKKELPKVLERENNTGYLSDELSGETKEELELERIVNQADALTDILVFTHGSGDMAGVNLEPVFDVVMASNMSKLDDNGEPIYNEFKKIQKSKHFIPPEPLIREEIKKQINQDENNE